MLRKAVLLLTSKWKLRKVTVGRRPRVFGKVRIDNRGRIVIADKFMAGGRLIPFELVTKQDARLTIGDSVYIHDGSSIACYGRIAIGSRVLIGRDVIITDSDQHRKEVSRRAEIPGFQPVKIHNDVWLGDRSMVLKGVTIGRGSIIGAGTLVNADVPPMEIWAGVPARKIGKVEG